MSFKRIHIAFPVWRFKIFRGFELSLLLFMDDRIFYLKNLGDAGKSGLKKVAPVIEAMAYIFYGQDANEVKRKIDSIKGRKVDIKRLKKISGKGSLEIPYEDLDSIYVKVPKVFGRDKVILEIYTKSGDSHEFNIGPLNLYKGYSIGDLYNEVIKMLRSIKDIEGYVKSDK